MTSRIFFVVVMILLGGVTLYVGCRAHMGGNSLSFKVLLSVLFEMVVLHLFIRNRLREESEISRFVATCLGITIAHAAEFAANHLPVFNGPSNLFDSFIFILVYAVVMIMSEKTQLYAMIDFIYDKVFYESEAAE